MRSGIRTRYRSSRKNYSNPDPKAGAGSRARKPLALRSPAIPVSRFMIPTAASYSKSFPADGLSVIIVLFNNENELTGCLESLPWKDLNLEVLAVDNRSTDGTRARVLRFQEKYPDRRVRLIENSCNLGFAAAVNQGLHHSLGGWIMLLGPDTEQRPDAFARMIRFMKKRPDIGLLAPQLLHPDGRIQPSCRNFPGLRDAAWELSGIPRLTGYRLMPGWKMPGFGHDAMREVEQPEATCLLTRRRAYRDVGDMDGRFPIFFNDVDWCRRFARKGWKTVFFPGAKITHLRGSSVQSRPLFSIWKSHQGFYRYFMKYEIKRGRRALCLALGACLIVAAAFRSAGAWALRETALRIPRKPDP
ncbi:glycosyltransferase family 2 protein [bacterium]|nr:glycosyltransferase family 2 protein [bacterium]